MIFLSDMDLLQRENGQLRNNIALVITEKEELQKDLAGCDGANHALRKINHRMAQEINQLRRDLIEQAAKSRKKS